MPSFEVLPEDRHEHPLGVRARCVALDQVERLAAARRPLGAGDQVLEPRVLRIDVLLAGDRADLALALLVERHRRPVERQRARRQVDHRVEHPVEVERGGDLAADVEQEGEVAGALLGGVELGVAEGRWRRRRRVLRAARGRARRRSPSPVSLLVTWIAPTVTPPATMAVAITLCASIWLERSMSGSNRGSSAARVTIVVFCCCATSPTKPVPIGTSAPDQPLAARRRRRSGSAAAPRRRSRSSPPSAPSAATTRWNTVGSSSSKSSDALNSRPIDWSSRRRSTSSRSSSVDVVGALMVGGMGLRVNDGLRLPREREAGARPAPRCGAPARSDRD